MRGRQLKNQSLNRESAPVNFRIKYINKIK